MAKEKYKQFYQMMWEQNEAALAAFQKTHDAFAKDKETNAEAFHTEGRDILDIMRDWERRLCSGMERGKFAAYSAKLSEKFWDEIKKDFPLIEEVGVRTVRT